MPPAAIYRVTVQGHIPAEWAVWFEGMHIATQPDGDTRLTGPLPDQAALHGLLVKIRNLNLVLTMVERLEEPGG